MTVWFGGGCRIANASRQQSAAAADTMRMDTLALSATSSVRTWQHGRRAIITNERYLMLFGRRLGQILHVREEEMHNTGLNGGPRCHATLELVTPDSAPRPDVRWRASVYGCDVTTLEDFVYTTENGCCGAQPVRRFVDLGSGELRFVGNDSLYPLEIPPDYALRFVIFWGNGSASVPPENGTDSVFLGLLQYGPATGRSQRIVVRGKKGQDCGAAELTFLSGKRTISGIAAHHQLPPQPNERLITDAISLSLSCYGLGDDRAGARIVMPIRGDSLVFGEARATAGVTFRSNPNVQLTPP